MEKKQKTSNRCYAAALPTDGSHGGQAWGPTKGQAESAALHACRMYALQTGGNPQTCRIVKSICNKSYPEVARLLPDESLEPIELPGEEEG